MSWIILLLHCLAAYLINWNLVAGKTYIVQIGKDQGGLKGEDFKLNRETSTEIKHIEHVRRVSNSNNMFSLRLYDLVKSQEGNLLMSPFSISAVMAMVSAGARANTFTQIMEGFYFPLPASLQIGYQGILSVLKSTDTFTLEAANTAFVHKSVSVLPSFQDILENMFHTSFQSINFGNGYTAAKKINNWVKEITRDKIKDIIKPAMLDSSTLLVLINAIYFKGVWVTSFDPKFTQNKNFYVSPSATVMVPMMNQVGKFRWAYLKPLFSFMVELPYKGDRIVMQVLLPQGKYGLEELEGKLANQDIQDLFEKESNETELSIQLPKFKLEQELNLRKSLIGLGMSDMFSIDSADFSGITGAKGLSVSDVVQKAFIEVNEEGSEAAAATVVRFRFRSTGGPKPFIANHPFIFYIRDKTTGMLLFQGRVVNHDI